MGAGADEGHTAAHRDAQDTERDVLGECLCLACRQAVGACLRVCVGLLLLLLLVHLCLCLCRSDELLLLFDGGSLRQHTTQTGILTLQLHVPHNSSVHWRICVIRCVHLPVLVL